MAYSRGVLVHNFNEDQFGIDLLSVSRPYEPPSKATSHLTHGWKQPSRELLPEPTQGLDRHILFGHTGDMGDPHTNLQKTDFAPASQYFMQNPAKIRGVGHLTADGFTNSDDPKYVEREPSVIADKARSRWGDGRQAHALKSNDRFMTSSRLAQEQAMALKTEEHVVERMIPDTREFSNVRDQVRLLRSNFRGSASNLKNTGKMIVQ